MPNHINDSQNRNIGESANVNHNETQHDNQASNRSGPYNVDENSEPFHRADEHRLAENGDDSFHSALNTTPAPVTTENFTRVLEELIFRFGRLSVENALPVVDTPLVADTPLVVEASSTSQEAFFTPQERFNRSLDNVHEAFYTPLSGRRLVFSSPEHSDYESADSDIFEHQLQVLEGGKLYLVDSCRKQREEVLPPARSLEGETYGHLARSRKRKLAAEETQRTGFTNSLELSAAKPHVSFSGLEDVEEEEEPELDCEKSPEVEDDEDYYDGPSTSGTSVYQEESYEEEPYFGDDEDFDKPSTSGTCGH